jgi:hypothetical protein
MYEQFLLTVTLLSLLSSMECSKIVDALMSQAFENGAAVIRQGEMGNTFFFIKEGEAKVTKTHQGDNGEMRKLVVGHPADQSNLRVYNCLSLSREANKTLTMLSECNDRGYCPCTSQVLNNVGSQSCPP